MPSYVPEHVDKCLTEKETEYVYNCIDKDVEIETVSNIVPTVVTDSSTDDSKHVEKMLEMCAEEIVENCFLQPLWGMDTHERSNAVDVNCYSSMISRKQKSHVVDSLANWSILSNIPVYAGGETRRGKCNYTDPSKRSVKKGVAKKTRKELTQELDFTDCLIDGEMYGEWYNDIKPHLNETQCFDEQHEIATTFLGPAGMTVDTQPKAEYEFPLTNDSYTEGMLVDGTKVKILIDQPQYFQARNIH